MGEEELLRLDGGLVGDGAGTEGGEGATMLVEIRWGIAWSGALVACEKYVGE